MRLRFLTYNLLNDDTFDRRLPAIRRVVAALDADICGFQEIPLAGGLERVAAALAYPCSASTSFRRPDDGWTETLAILSRFPVEQAEPLELRPGVPNCLRVRLSTSVGPVDVFNLHLHPRETVLRRSEMDFVLMRARALRSNPVVILGDFNAVPTGQTMQLARGQFRSAFEDVHGRPADSTFPTPMRADLSGAAGAVLDHVLYRGGEFRPLSAAVIGNPGPDGEWPSDHWGVMVELDR